MIPNINQLHQENKLKEKQEEKYYKSVLDICIEQLNKIHISLKQTYFIFTVPEILLNFPNYKKDICLMYIYNNFKKAKYNVEIISHNQICIDWSVRKENKTKIYTKNDQEKFLKELFPKAKFEIIYK